MSKLISPEYLALNQELHQRKVKYGGKGDAWTERVLKYIRKSDAKSYLDYGCGKGNLLAGVRAVVRDSVTCVGYDPVTAPMTEEELEAAKFDFVTCNDVLEHIERDRLDDVLASIAGCIAKRGLLVISQRLANKTLADGRNAHLIVEKTPWWIERLSKHFAEIIEVEPIKPKRVGIELAVLVRPRADETPAYVRLIER